MKSSHATKSSRVFMPYHANPSLSPLLASRAKVTLPSTTLASLSSYALLRDSVKGHTHKKNHQVISMIFLLLGMLVMFKLTHL